MNAKTIIASIILTIGAAPGFASAAGAITDGAALSRVEVRAELARFQAADNFESRNEGWGTVVPVSTRSRAEVLNELRVARESGLLDETGETYGSIDARNIRSTRSRTAVAAEAQGGGLSRGNHGLYLGG